MDNDHHQEIEQPLVKKAIQHCDRILCILLAVVPQPLLQIRITFAICANDRGVGAGNAHNASKLLIIRSFQETKKEE